MIKSIDCDLFTLCETFLTNSNVIEVEGYSWFGNNRQDIDKNATRGSGGVGVLVKNEICNDFQIEKLDRSFDGILWLKLTNKQIECDKVIVCTCYCPPPSSSRGNISQEFYDRLLTDVYMYYDRLCPCIITGDFNARIGDLKDFDSSLDVVKNRTCIDTIKRNHESFLNFLNDSQFCILNGRFDSSKDNFTSISGKGCAVVDYMCTPYDILSCVSEFSVTTMREIVNSLDFQSSELSALPDHSILRCVLNTSPYSKCSQELRQAECPISPQSNSPSVNTQKRYKITNVNIDMFVNERCKHALLNIINNLENNVKTQGELNSAYSNFIDVLQNEMDKTFKSYECNNKKMRTRFRKPWWNDNLKKLFQTAQSAEKTYLKGKKKGVNTSLLRHMFVNKRKQFDRVYRKEKRKYLSSFQAELFQLKYHNPKKFWEEISNLGPQKKQKEIPHEVVLNDGTVTSNINEILQKWENDYKNLLNTHTSVNSSSNEFVRRVKETLTVWDNDYRGILTNMNAISSNPGNIINDNLNRDISCEEVSTALKLAKNGKAVGCDNIPNEILKCKSIDSVLHALFNKCLHFGMVPNMWSQTLILPIAKPGKDPRIPSNCRGISLISTLSKVFSTILNLRLVEYLDNKDILCEEQNGFRKMRSCLEHIYTLSTIIKSKKKYGKPVFACFIDFSKAFDSVNRDLLWIRLLKYGVDGKFLQVLKAMYTNLQACVKLHNHLTNWFGSYIGVRQGDTLSPTLFNVFVNDLANEIKELDCGVKLKNKTISILLYADDIVLISESEKSLQEMLDTVHRWCQKWQLGINCSKTQVIHFRKSSEQETNFVFKIGDKHIEKVQKYKYLGVELNSSLNFSETVETLANAGSRSLGSLVHKHFKVNGLQPHIFKELYEATVCKIIDYGAGVWGGPSYNKCDTIQHRAMRTILGVGRQTPIPFLYFELGWTPPNIRQKLEMVRLWYHLVGLSDKRLPKQIFMLDTTQWKRNVQTMFKKANLSAVFDSDNAENLPFTTIFEKIKVTLTKEMIKNLTNSMENMSRLCHYRAFETVLNFSEQVYVLSCKNRNYRSIIAKLRSSTFNKIRVESGRYRNIQRELRICKRCDSHSIDDEIHALLYCTKFQDDRGKLIQQVCKLYKQFETCDDIGKLKILLSAPDIVNSTARFIVQCDF